METLYPTQPRRARIFGGLTERQEHIFTWIGVVVVLLYLTAWALAIRHTLDIRREAALFQHLEYPLSAFRRVTHLEVNLTHFGPAERACRPRNDAF